MEDQAGGLFRKMELEVRGQKSFMTYGLPSFYRNYSRPMLH
jgi:hypothetical protein